MKTDHGANAKHPLLVTDDQAPVSMQHVPGVSGQSAPKSRYTTFTPNGDAPQAARTINFRSHDNHGTVNNVSLLRSQRPTIKERLLGSENSKTQPSFQFDTMSIHASNGAMRSYMSNTTRKSTNVTSSSTPTATD
jgi:hypothetical protein